MVTVFGNNIIGAYSNGDNVKEIYTYGQKVWPQNSQVDYLQGRWPEYRQTSSSSGVMVKEPPRIELRIPFVPGGLVLEADVRIYMTPEVGSSFPFFVSYVYRNYQNETKWWMINGAFLSVQSNVYIRNGYSRSNIETPVSLGNHILTMTIPPDQYDTQLFCDNTEAKTGDEYEKPHYVFSDSEIIRITLFETIYPITGSNHHLKRFKIKDSNNNVLYDFVPFVFNGEAGLFDTLHNTFYGKADKVYDDELLNFIYGNY